MAASPRLASDFTGLGLSRAFGSLAFGLAEAFLGMASDWLSGVRQARAGETDVHGCLTCHPNLPRDLGQAAAQYLAHKGYQPGTIGKYVNITHHLFAWAGHSTLRSVTAKQVEEFMAARAAAGVGTAALRVDLAALRTVLDKIFELGVTRDLTYSPPSPPTPGLDQTDIARLLQHAVQAGDRVLVLAANVLDLRVGEIAALKFSDFLPHEKVVVLRNERKRRAALIEVPQRLLALVQELQGDTSRDAYIFHRPNDPTRPLTVRALQKRLKRLGAGVGANVTFRALRATPSVVSADGESEMSEPATLSKEETPDRAAISAPVSAVRTMIEEHDLSCRPENAVWRVGGSTVRAFVTATPARRIGEKMPRVRFQLYVPKRKRPPG